MNTALSVKKFLTRISATELLGRKGERPGYSAALFYVPERIMAAKGKRYLSIAPKNHNNMNHMAIVKIKDATPVIAPPPTPSFAPVLSHSFFRDYALLLISGRRKAGSTGNESHLRTT